MLSSKIHTPGVRRWLLARCFTQVRNFSKKDTTEVAAKEDDEEPKIPPTFVDDLNEVDQEVVNCDKSRLLPQHLRLLKNERPYLEAHSWIHLTEKYQRKLYGRYGSASGIDPRICFPTSEDIENQKEFERVAYPFTLEEMIKKNKEQKTARIAKIIKREEDVEKKIVKLEQLKEELETKIAKKEADAQAAKEKKERLVEEVRRHFGFKIDPRDDRFKEMLEQKEKEDKKKQKEAKRKAKEDKMVAKLMNSNKQEVETNKQENS